MFQYHSRPPLWWIGSPPVCTHWDIQSISCVNYSLFKTVNENAFILFLLLLLYPILSANVCIIVYLDLFCEISTHLHDIRANGLLRKIYTKIVCRYKRLKTAERWNSKKNSFLHLTTILHGRRKYKYISDIERCTG